MKTSDIKRILIIGGGTMGQQIGLQCAMYGCDVVIYDIKEDILANALSGIKKLMKGFVAQGRITQENSNEILGRISTTTIPEDAAADIDLVSESVPEDPELKGRIFSQFNALCPEHTIFTTNTSTLLPSMFADATGRPDRFLAFHFHDIRVTNVVDVMPHPKTSAEIIQLVKDFSLHIGLNPIVMKKESIGYVFNYMIMALFQAAQTLAARDVASVNDIDRAWMGVTQMGIGPFGMMDSIGLDTVWKITDYWSRKGKDPQSIKNAEFLKVYVDKGNLGQKSKKGFYSYPIPEFTQPGFIKGQTQDKIS